MFWEKAPAQAPAQAEQTVVTDSAFQAAAAGEYKSADGERCVTLNSDFSVKVKGLDKEFYKWELPAKPEGKAAVIILSRKGLDADVQEQATLDTEEGSIIIKNETFRKSNRIWTWYKSKTPSLHSEGVLFGISFI